MRKMPRVNIFLLLLIFILFPFQNCGKGFQSASSDLTSAQCHANIKATATEKKMSARDLNCGDFNVYVCERRIFGPDLSNMSHSLKECLQGADSVCVDVEIYQFNTMAARAAGGDAGFAPGGEYNREETRCYHRMVYRGVTLFEGAGETLEESLAKAMAACEKAVGT